MSAAISAILLASGVLVLLMCAAGVLAMSSLYERLHYASAAGWGVLLVALAILARESFSLIADKALATAALLVVTGPAIAHATARAARIRRRGAWNAPFERADGADPDGDRDRGSERR